MSSAEQGARWVREAIYTDQSALVDPPRELAELLTSAKIWGFYDLDEDGSPISAPILRQPTSQHVAATRSFFIDHCEAIPTTAFNPQFKEQLNHIDGFIPPFTEAVSSKAQNEQQKIFISIFMAWTYVFDDAVTLLIAKTHSTTSSNRQILSRKYVDAINAYTIECWNNGLMHIPAPSIPQQTSLPAEFHPILLIARLSHDCATLLANMYDGRIEILQPVSRELLRTLRGITDQAQTAPQDRATYFDRHSRTGGCRIFFLLSIIFELTNLGHEAFLDLSEPENSAKRRLIEVAELSILLSNDLNAAKDIRDGDDAYLALAIIEEAERIGHPVARRRSGLRNPAFHGKVIHDYLCTPLGFAAMQSLVVHLRDTFDTLWQVAQEFPNSSPAAGCTRRAILQWAYGYHINSAVSPRYRRSFQVFMQSTQNDFESFVQAVTKAWAS